ncbi:MAG: glycosyltransferase [Sedimentisphaerales bacterium]|nr:glycosyltransferase [Sedimentisphaerales bacterium]
MKFTLAFQVYNKAESIESVMDSWIKNLSGRHECEIIVVFDDCKDASVEILHRYLRAKRQDYIFLFADDRYEIFCNNLALKYASGDYIIFIQDDNWIYDEQWDWVLGEVLGRVENVGAAGLLAGVELLPDTEKIRLKRIEIDRPHKGEYFSSHNLPCYDFGVWQVDSIARPFCISRELLLLCGGLDTAFCPTCGDDLDLGIKLLKQGKRNIYIPFDLVNTVASKGTFDEGYYTENYNRAYAVNFARHQEYITQKKGGVELIIPMRQGSAGQLVFTDPAEQGQGNTVSHESGISVGEHRGDGRFTLFAMPKAFRGVFTTIQRNAIGSWMRLRDRPEIILLGSDDGVEEFCRENGLRHVPNVECNEFGTPFLNDLFVRAEATASNEICVYVNADIILMDDFSEAVLQAGGRFDEFLMIGQRWDLSVTEGIDFGVSGWRQRLIDEVKLRGRLHAPTGIDYFAFRKGLWGSIPPMSLGRDVWDNWLVREPLLAGKAVVDASGTVMIVHHDHDSSHIAGGKKSDSFRIEQRRNIELGGNDRSLAYTSHANWELTPAGIRLRRIDEFLKGDNLSAAIKCIESSYRQMPEEVRRQCVELNSRIDGELWTRLIAAARRELVSGCAPNASRLLLDSLESGQKAAAAERLRKGIECLNEGVATEAIRYLEDAATGCMMLPNLYYALAAAYAQAGRIEEARRACRVELSLEPGNRGAAELLERIEHAANECEHGAGIYG